MSKHPIRVSLAIFPECDPSIIFGVFDTLWAVRRGWLNEPVAPVFEPRLVGAERGPLKLVTGVTIVTQDAIADVEETDVVFVPNVVVHSPEALRALDPGLIEWIGRMHSQGAQLYASCGGALVLAATGLLDGREATTHWSYAPLFESQFPRVNLQADRLLVQTGPGHNLVCSGGASSWQDLALLLVAKHAGTEEAIRMSKLFLYQWHRDGQLPYACLIQNVDHGDAVMAQSQQWIADNYQQSDIVTALVNQSGLPKRTFDRRFKAATGYSPLAYIQALRIEEAKQMLETTDEPIDVIARQVGYEDGASFRRLFRRLAGMNPGDYRRKLQPPSFVKAAGSQAKARAIPPARDS